MAKPAIIEHNDNRHNSIRGEVLLLRAVMQQTSKYIKWKFQQLYCTMKQTGDLFSHHQKSGKPNSAPTLYSGDEAPSAHNGVTTPHFDWKKTAVRFIFYRIFYNYPFNGEKKWHQRQ
jgi:hypothetical protein